MNVIYEPKGRAKEYCDLALNLYEGCSHGCMYCYVPAILHKTREEFRHVKPREGILEAIEKEAPKYSGREVLLCFTCDPYPEIKTSLLVTRQAIEILLGNKIIVRILTKAGRRSSRDFDLLAKHNYLSCYGASLTFVGLKESSELEPFSASPFDRINTLQQANTLGIDTWVSLEPVMDPVQSLELINLTHKFVDEYKVGKLNHNKELEQKIDKEYGWKRFTNEAIELLEKYGKRYYIKKDLRKYLS